MCSPGRGLTRGAADGPVLVLDLLDALPSAYVIVLKTHLRNLLGHTRLPEVLKRAELELLDEDALARKGLHGPGRRDREGLRAVLTDRIEREIAGPHGCRLRERAAWPPAPPPPCCPDYAGSVTMQLAVPGQAVAPRDR